MAGDTLTFEMGGRVEIGQLQRGIAQFSQLVAALTQGTGVRWVIDDLQPGSAVVTLRGEAADTGKVERIVDEYESIGRALESREDLHYSLEVNRAAQAIGNLARTFEYVRFETLSGDYTISGNGAAPPRRISVASIGAITGRVQTLSNRESLRFNLYDTVHDKAVGCYLQPGQEELMRDAWGRRARVSGRISRERDSGRPMAVRQILGIEILEDIAPGSYRLAQGAVPWQLGDAMPEEVIRRLRDARETENRLLGFLRIALVHQRYAEPHSRTLSAQGLSILSSHSRRSGNPEP